MAALSALRLAVGTYNHFTYGLQLVQQGAAAASAAAAAAAEPPAGGARYAMSTLFSCEAHDGVVKCIAASPGRWLASGGADEQIQ